MLSQMSMLTPNGPLCVKQTQDNWINISFRSDFKESAKSSCLTDCWFARCLFRNIISVQYKFRSGMKNSFCCSSFRMWTPRVRHHTCRHLALPNWKFSRLNGKGRTRVLDDARLTSSQRISWRFTDFLRF